MKVLLVHNYYQQPGGEDVVFTAEAALLRSRGHVVVELTDHNRRIDGMNRATLALNTIWSRSSAAKLERTLRARQPDAVHFHNTFPLISPSVFYACQKADVPVVQSLHNPRLICPAATFCRDGHVCEDCMGKTPPWPGILHACYRGSRTQTAGVAAMLTLHRWLNTWQRQVDIYVVFTEFYRRKFIEGGIPVEKIIVKPHFIDPDPGFRGTDSDTYALFINRLDPEKGVRTLLNAWQHLKGIPLKIRGDGRLLTEVNAVVSKNNLDSVNIVGRLSRKQLWTLMKGARFLVWPSEGYYETFGLVAIEAFACGVPVIASNLGAMSEIVDDGRTGLHFQPGNAEELAAKVKWAWNHPAEMERMGREARQEYESKYTAEKNYQMLMEIYQTAISGDHASRGAGRGL